MHQPRKFVFSYERMGSGDETSLSGQYYVSGEDMHFRKSLSVRGLKNMYFVTISAYSATKNSPHSHEDNQTSNLNIVGGRNFIPRPFLHTTNRHTHYIT